MTTDEWADWSVYHQDLHGLKGDDGDDLVRMWREVLIGYRFDDLRAASLWIASHASREWRTKHLQLLRERIFKTVTERASADAMLNLSMAEKSERANRCVACDGNGKLDVPDLGSVVGGEWIPRGRTYDIVTIFCACSIGEARYRRTCADLEELKKTARPTSLLFYEQRNPDWREQMERRESMRKAEIAEARLAGHMDRTKGPLAAMLNKIVESRRTY